MVGGIVSSQEAVLIAGPLNFERRAQHFVRNAADNRQPGYEPGSAGTAP